MIDACLNSSKIFENLVLFIKGSQSHLIASSETPFLLSKAANELEQTNANARMDFRDIQTQIGTFVHSVSGFSLMKSK